MKQSLFVVAATAAMALAACSDNNSTQAEPASTDGQIRFSASTQSTTRAYQYGTDVTTNTLDEFNVFAYIANPTTTDNGKPYMDNVLVSKGQNNVWTYSPVQYWPQSALNFYAYAPAEGWNAYRDTPIDDVSQPFTFYNGTAQYDIVYATAMNRTQPTTPGADAQVRFNFRHALAKTQINMRSVPSNLSVVVGLVTFNNIYSEGDFTFPTQSTTPAAQPEPESIGTWSNQKDPIAYPCTFPQLPSERIMLTTQYQQLNQPHPEMGGASMVGPYMIPQSVAFNSTAPTSGPCMRIHLTVYDNSTHTQVWPNANTPGDMLEDPDHPLNNHDGILTFPLSSTASTATGNTDVREWKPGHLYVYNITIDPTQLLGEIDFGQPTVDGFITVETAY